MFLSVLFDPGQPWSTRSSVASVRLKNESLKVSDYPVPRFGMGAFRIGLDAVYQHLTGCALPYTQIGKPFKTTYDFAERMLRRRLDEMGRPSRGELNVYMVGGESLSTSIKIPVLFDLCTHSLRVTRTGSVSDRDVPHYISHVSDLGEELMAQTTPSPILQAQTATAGTRSCCAQAYIGKVYLHINPRP